MRGERPRILLLGDTLQLGGTEGQFVEVATRLERSRWDVHVSCLRAEGPLGTRLDSAGMRAWSCGRGSFKPTRFLMAACGLARYLRAYQIRLVHSFDFYSNLLGVPAARLAKVPVVIASQRDLGNLRPPLQHQLHRMVLRLADYLVVNSEAVLARVKIPPSRIALIPNGVDSGRFSPSLSGAKPRSGQVTIGTLANLRPEKGLADFVQAAALVRARWSEGRFLIWGEGPLRLDLEGLVDELGLSGSLELRGATSEPEVVLRELDIFVLPSHSEACSNVLLEAMATGLPVVATSVGGNLALVEDEVTGLLVPPGHPTALAKSIIRLIEDPALAADLAAQGRDRVRAQFTFERMLAHVEALYEQALGARGS